MAPITGRYIARAGVSAGRDVPLEIKTLGIAATRAFAGQDLDLDLDGGEPTKHLRSSRVEFESCGTDDDTLRASIR